MSKKSAFLLLASIFVGACGSTVPPAVRAPEPPPPPAHQSQEKPKLPEKLDAHGKGGHDADAPKKTKLTFDLPPGYEQAPASSVPKPWKMAFYNREQLAQVLMDFDVRGAAPAAEIAALIAREICPRKGWTCSKPQPLPDGSGAYFTITTDKANGKIAVRDLDGSARCQLQLFGLWSKDNDAAAKASFDVMLSSAEVQ
jgi:hypothetical protein